MKNIALALALVAGFASVAVAANEAEKPADAQAYKDPYPSNGNSADTHTSAQTANATSADATVEAASPAEEPAAN